MVYLRLAVRAESRKSLAVGAPLLPTFLIFSFEPALIRARLAAILQYKTWLAHLHPHLALAALPRSPFQPWLRAQKDFFLAASRLVFGLGAGGLRLLPVSLLYFALPFAVKPAPSLTDCFSPRPTDRETPFLDIGPSTFPINNQGLLPGFLSFLWNREVNPFIKFSNDLLKR
jgi:hypothetical protein